MIIRDPDKLRRRRQQMGYTQAEFAYLIGRTQQYVSALERGVDKDCSEQTANRIAKRLDVQLEDYFETRTRSVAA